MIDEESIGSVVRQAMHDATAAEWRAALSLLGEGLLRLDRRLAAIEGQRPVDGPEASPDRWQTMAENVWHGRKIGADLPYITDRIAAALAQARVAGRLEGVEAAARHIDPHHPWLAREIRALASH